MYMIEGQSQMSNGKGKSAEYKSERIFFKIYLAKFRHIEKLYYKKLALRVKGCIYNRLDIPGRDTHFYIIHVNTVFLLLNSLSLIPHNIYDLMMFTVKL